MTEDQIRALAYHLTDVLADRWDVDRCGTDQADDAALVAAFLRGRLEPLLTERPPPQEAQKALELLRALFRGWDSDDFVEFAEVIDNVEQFLKREPLGSPTP